MKALYINGSRESGGEKAQKQREDRVLKEFCNPLNLDCTRTQAVFLNPAATAWNKYHHWVGLSIAHKRALDKVATGKYGERVIILEDDVVIPEHVSASQLSGKINAFLEDTADTDLVYLGNCNNRMCSHALAVTKSGAQKIIDTSACFGNGDLSGKCSAVDEEYKSLCKLKKISCDYATNYPTYDIRPGSHQTTKHDRQKGLVHQGPQDSMGTHRIDKSLI